MAFVKSGQIWTIERHMRNSASIQLNDVFSYQIPKHIYNNIVTENERADRDRDSQFNEADHLLEQGGPDSYRKGAACHFLAVFWSEPAEACSWPLIFRESICSGAWSNGAGGEETGERRGIATGAHWVDRFVWMEVGARRWRRVGCRRRLPESEAIDWGVLFGWGFGGGEVMGIVFIGRKWSIILMWI